MTLEQVAVLLVGVGFFGTVVGRSAYAFTVCSCFFVYFAYLTPGSYDFAFSLLIHFALLITISRLFLLFEVKNV